MTSLHLYETLRSEAEALEGLQILVTGNWPMLKELDLAHLHMNDECAGELALGQWPASA